MPTVLITGVSRGIGRATAALFARRGWTVIGTVRPGGQAEAPALTEHFDLGNPESAVAVAHRVLDSHGAPDVIINNAGTLAFGAVEDTPLDEMRRLFEVNVFANIALIQAFVPAMRKRGGGQVVNVTSLGGRMTFPFYATYNASKHAMEGYSEGLWHELKPFGIRMKAVEPGFVATGIWERSKRAPGTPAEGSAPYRPYLEAMARFAASVPRQSTPEQAAEEILRAVMDPSDRLRYPIAAYARTFVRLRRALGEMAVMRFMHDRWMGTDRGD